MLKDLFLEQKNSLDAFFASIDIAQVQAVLEKLCACKGTVFLSGVGKSGHIAQKIAATFVSTGTKAAFLSPVHALHGDIGLVANGDLILFFSKSGESQELVELIPHVKKRGAYAIAVVSHLYSRLAKMADLSVFLPVGKELCPFDLAPTTSTVVQLLFGDCLAVALMRIKNFTLTDFASNHPAGLLGRKATLAVSDVMLKGEAIPICHIGDILIDLLHCLSAKRCGCLLVCNREGNLRGIFTDGDLRRSIENHGPGALHLPIETLMSSTPKIIAPDRLLIEAMQRMEEDPSRPVTVLPVIEKEQVVGLLRMHDILQVGLASKS